MPTTHTTTVSQERLILVYVIVRGLPIDVVAIIEREIRDCTMKKHKTIALLFPSLLTSIYLVSGVHITEQDECIKTKRARTVKRIAGESATAPTKLATIIGLTRVLGVERRLQELSDSVTQCA